MVSKIWKHFLKEKKNEKFVRTCIVCGFELSTPKDGSTSNMFNHLKAKHFKEFEFLINEDNKNTEEPKILSFYKKSAVIIDKQKILDESLVRTMVRQNLSFCFFDDEDQQNLIKKAYPDLKVHKRNYFCRNIVPNMANNIQTTIVNQIGNKYFSITSDGWSRPSNDISLLSITIHYINDHFERIDRVLATIPIEQSHTGNYIASLIEECIINKQLKLEKIAAIVRDDARNMQKSCQLLKIDSFQCACHFLHLLVTTALKSNKKLIETINIVRQWVTSMHKSYLIEMIKKVHIFSNMPTKKIPIDVITRWNSTYIMMEEFIAQKDVLLSVEMELRNVQEAKKKPINVSQTTWNTLKRLANHLYPLNREIFTFLKDLCRILKIFFVETCRLSKEQSTCSSYIPTLVALYSALKENPTKNNELILVYQTLIDGLESKLNLARQIKSLKLALIIDPRFAYELVYLKEYEWNGLEDEIIELIIKNEYNTSSYNEITIEEKEISEEIFSDDLDENSMDIDIWKNVSKNKGLSQSSSGSKNELKAVIKAELSFYRHNLQRPLINSNIFFWWKQNKTRFEYLYKVASILLTIPATSVSSERIFSKAGLIYANSLRNRLHAKTAEQILIIKANIDKIEMAPPMEIEKEDSVLEELFYEIDEIDLSF